jgi:hypothetical protein
MFAAGRFIVHTTVYSGAIVGIDGLVVEVEVDIARIFRSSASPAIWRPPT